jgi:23S rRNA (guanosine2251-2'-O)-methyltransferase
MSIELLGIHCVLTQIEHDFTKIKSISYDPSLTNRLDNLLAKAKKHKISLQATKNLKQKEGVAVKASCKKLYEYNQSNYLELVETKQKSLIIALDQVSDPQNLGNLLRSAASFNVDFIISPKQNSTSLTNTAIKVSSGGASIVPFIELNNLAREIAHLQSKGYWVYGADMDNGNALNKIAFHDKTVVVLGSEGSGMRELTKKSCDELFHIPTNNKIASLNVAMAGNIIISQAYFSKFL